jgi:hypothetical protein
MGPAQDEPAACPRCGRRYPLDSGILLAMGELSGKNRITEAFYNGPRFQKFRFWENLFLWYAGGLKGARRQILRHLPPLEGGSLLEVGIGDGANVRLLPEAVRITVWLDASARPAASRGREEQTPEPPLVFQTVARLNLAASSQRGTAGGAPGSRLRAEHR